MSLISASPPVPEHPLVWFHGVDEWTRGWVMELVPEAQYTLVRRDGTQVACYSEHYLQRLSADFKVNGAENTRAVICLHEPCCDSYLDLLRLHARHIIYPDALFAEDAVRLAICPPGEWSQGDAPFFSIESARLSQVETWAVESRADVDAVVGRTVGYFEGFGHGSGQAQAAGLVVKEGVTNCIFHAFRRPGSHERRYDPDGFEGLLEPDVVEVRAGRAEGMTLLSIKDNAGVLSALRIGNSLDRQQSERGLLDSRGRGLYLMNHMANRMVIVVSRGVSTALELYFLQEPPEEAREERRLRHFELVELAGRE